MPEIIINDINYLQHVTPPAGQGKGCVPRNYATHPLGYLACAAPFNLPLIPETEWQARLEAQMLSKAQLSNVRNTGGPGGGPIPSRDQNGKGYCWAHSGVSAHLVARARMGEPYADLSAYAVACIIKNYADEGGWGSEGIEFEASRGVPTAEFWPQQSMSKSNDNANTWANAAKHKYIQWLDLDPHNMKAQLVTCLLLGFPVVSDFDWWSHSVCTIDLVSVNPFQTRIWNSWGDSWSQNGTGILDGSKAIPDSAWACIITSPSQG